MTRLLKESFLLQATADKFSRLNTLNALKKKPIDLSHRLSLIASKSVHNAFHHEVLAYARKAKESRLEELIESRISALDQLMLKNEIE